jgi:PilZ domain
LRVPRQQKATIFPHILEAELMLGVCPESCKVQMKQPDVSRSQGDGGLARKAVERRETRQRVLKRASIAFNGRKAVIDCTVRNLSSHGACLNVESPVGIPDPLDLMLGHQPVRSCRVAWRKATQIGVEFV